MKTDLVPCGLRLHVSTTVCPLSVFLCQTPVIAFWTWCQLVPGWALRLERRLLSSFPGFGVSVLPDWLPGPSFPPPQWYPRLFLESSAWPGLSSSHLCDFTGNVQRTHPVGMGTHVRTHSWRAELSIHLLCLEQRWRLAAVGTCKCSLSERMFLISAGYDLRG